MPAHCVQVSPVTGAGLHDRLPVSLCPESVDHHTELIEYGRPGSQTTSCVCKAQHRIVLGYPGV